jgi:hypothetical protein
MRSRCACVTAPDATGRHRGLTAAMMPPWARTSPSSSASARPLARATPPATDPAIRGRPRPMCFYVRQLELRSPPRATPQRRAAGGRTSPRGRLRLRLVSAPAGRVRRGPGRRHRSHGPPPQPGTRALSEPRAAVGDAGDLRHVGDDEHAAEAPFAVANRLTRVTLVEEAPTSRTCAATTEPLATLRANSIYADASNVGHCLMPWVRSAHGRRTSRAPARASGSTPQARPARRSDPQTFHVQAMPVRRAMARLTEEMQRAVVGRR